MKTYKAVFYDLDGTLVNTLDMNLYPLLRILREETGRDWPIAELLPYFSYPGLQLLEELGIRDVETTYARWVRYVNEYETGATPFDGVPETLKTIKDHGIIQAVVSSKLRKQYEIDVVGNNLHVFMETAVLADDTKKHKPHPDPLLLCLERLGLSAEDVLYVGDSPSDYVAACRAGMDFGYAKWGSVNQEGIDCPAFVFDQPEDMQQVFDFSGE